MMFNQYPYLNLNDLNLDYILAQIKTMMNEVTNFVSINAIKYANPIQWDITRQYEKNTVVIDPVTGTAYISVAPVPAGVALTRPEYWTVVFDLGSFVTRAAQNFTSRWESDTTTTATFPTNMGEWLVWGDVLYKALTNITAGDTYVVGGNIEHFTIEDLYNTYLNTIAQILAIIGNLPDLNTYDKSSIVNAINEVNTNRINDAAALQNEIGALGDLSTTDKTNLVNAINEVLADLGQEIIDRGNAVSTETTNRINADNALLNNINTREFNWYNRHFLFLGDSYGDESGEWADLLISYLNLSSRAYKLCVSGAGFYNPNPIYQFVTQLENFVNNHTQDEIDAITDIVICGGLNDSISTSPLGYNDVTAAMGSFNTYLRAHFPWARVSLGYIGNGDDLDLNSLIGARVYAARQCCRYTYFNTAALYNWEILHNCEYALTGNKANIDTDGVHPTAAGSVEIFRAVAEALVNGSADYNYPVYSAGMAGLVGVLSGDIAYKIHNNVASLSARNVSFSVGAGTQFTSGASVAIASIGNIKFNEGVNILARVRLYGADIDADPTTNYLYVSARLTFLGSNVYMTILESDGTTMHTYTWQGAGNYVIEDFDVDFDSMLLV